MEKVKQYLLSKSPDFWPAIESATKASKDFADLFALATLRKRALKSAIPRPPGKLIPIRLAIIGAYSFYPLRELVEHMLTVRGYEVELFVGEFDNYNSEMLDKSSALYEFKPDTVLFLPSEKRCRYSGNFLDPHAFQLQEAQAITMQIQDLCRQLHEGTQAEILLCNFMPPVDFDPGQYRTRTLASDWNFRRTVNTQLGITSAQYITICDVEFLAARRGLEIARDERAWFETKQPGSSQFLVDLSAEVTQLVGSLRQSPKKVLVLDLDNTVWGGVIGDMGVEGIEIGDTSPRGEAFKAFQKYALDLSRRGVLLAVCSKNDHDVAMAPFLNHPEMVLKAEHFAAFKANWEPKSENLKRIAQELNLGLDSLVFVDDNPAEVEIVRQFAPSVTAILLGPDPANYVRELSDARLFEPRAITQEDQTRSQLYQAEEERQKLADTTTDMDAYLSSLQMEAVITEFTELDAPRISQLINKSNQFNLTTHRRTEAEVLALIKDPSYSTFSIRLADRFGDHGLIAVFVGKVEARNFVIDTWLMSCRVLKRQVEEEFLNEVMRLALSQDCTSVVGTYLPTAKNGMVEKHYPNLGFSGVKGQTDFQYELDSTSYSQRTTHIKVVRRAYEPSDLKLRSQAK